MLVLLALYFLGGATINGFATALIAGVSDWYILIYLRGE